MTPMSDRLVARGDDGEGVSMPGRRGLAGPASTRGRGSGA